MKDLQAAVKQFRESFEPRNVKEYTGSEALQNSLKYGHWGPWE